MGGGHINDIDNNGKNRLNYKAQNTFEISHE